MKRYGDLFKHIVDINNIRLAHANARKGKTHYREVVLVDSDVDKYCLMIQAMLMFKTYRVSPYKTFKKVDKGKQRELFKLPYFPDRIIQHAIMQVVEPIWKRTLIADTYQAIKGRGTFKCLRKIEKAVDAGNHYCLQIDIKKFYPSIGNDILKAKVREKIKCKDTLYLLDEIITSCDGVPIGNYISQYFGNIMLSKLDHSMKEGRKARHYFRYCDDIVILSNSKSDLHLHKFYLAGELNKLGLSVKQNHQVFKITKTRGVDFLGVVTYTDKVRLRKSIVASLKRLT